MGPALIFGCLFLALYGLAGAALSFRRPAWAAGCGFAVGTPSAYRHRERARGHVAFAVDNLVHGGDQLAHSLWAFATGGFAGTGVGLGDPQVVPAAHTDLILSVLARNAASWAWPRRLGSYAFLVYRAFRIALRARTIMNSSWRRASRATALQVLVIAGGALGAFPLTGV